MFAEAGIKGVYWGKCFPKIQYSSVPCRLLLSGISRYLHSRSGISSTLLVTVVIPSISMPESHRSTARLKVPVNSGQNCQTTSAGSATPHRRTRVRHGDPIKIYCDTGYWAGKLEESSQKPYTIYQDWVCNLEAAEGAWTRSNQTLEQSNALWKKLDEISRDLSGKYSAAKLEADKDRSQWEEAYWEEISQNPSASPAQLTTVLWPEVTVNPEKAQPFEYVNVVLIIAKSYHSSLN